MHLRIRAGSDQPLLLSIEESPRNASLESHPEALPNNISPQPGLLLQSSFDSGVRTTTEEAHERDTPLERGSKHQTERHKVGDWHI